MDDVWALLCTLLAAALAGYWFGRSSRSSAGRVKLHSRKSAAPPAFELIQSNLPATLTSRLFPSVSSASQDNDEGSHQRRRLVVAAYRLPIRVTKVNGTWKVDWASEHSPISNMNLLKNDTTIVFVGWPGIHVPREEQDEFEDLLQTFNCVPVFLDESLHSSFFTGFCKAILWPLFHYMMPASKDDFAVSWDSLWQAYTTVNMLFSRKVIVNVDDDDDTIWVHNYHLLLVPSFIRKKLPRAKIGLFLHTPFPTSDVFRCLPGRTNLLRGLLCSDLIGFHTYDYARHFLSTCKRVLDLDFETLPGGTLGVNYCGRSVSIRISHVGVTADSFAKKIQTPELQKICHTIRQENPGRRLIVAADHLDAVNGLLVKIQAFERFLECRSEWAQEVTLVELLMPSSNLQEERDSIRSSINKHIRAIRQKHGDQVIKLIDFGQNFNVDTILAYLSLADVAFLTAFWDGLNVLPFEFTAVQQADDPGALVISEFMGCSRSLNGVLRVNPWKLEEVGEAIHTALLMCKDERQAFHSRRYRYVMTHDFDYWARGFLRDLDEAARQSSELNFVQVGWGSNVRLIGLRADFRRLEEGELVASYRQFKKRLLLLDYDGTLVTHGDHNFKGKPAESTLKLLRILCSDLNNVVFILSGRERSKLTSWFGTLSKLGIAAEKGVFIKWPGQTEWESMPNLGDFSWKPYARELMQAYTERTDGCYIEEKESALVWHYHNADPEFGRMQSSELGKYLQKVMEPSNAVDVVKYDYDRILEVKPRGVSKGVAARRIISRLKGEAGLPHFLLSIGDDRSDEDTFQALTSGYVKSEGKIYTCCVGIKPSNAHYYLHDTHEVLKVLNSLSVVSAHALRAGHRLQTLRHNAATPQPSLRSPAFVDGSGLRNRSGGSSSNLCLSGFVS